MAEAVAAGVAEVNRKTGSGPKKVNLIHTSREVGITTVPGMAVEEIVTHKTIKVAGVIKTLIILNQTIMLPTSLIAKLTNLTIHMTRTYLILKLLIGIIKYMIVMKTIMQATTIMLITGSMMLTEVIIHMLITGRMMLTEVIIYMLMIDSMMINEVVTHILITDSIMKDEVMTIKKSTTIIDEGMQHTKVVKNES